MTSRQRQVLDSWLRGEPVADTCDRLRISRQRYYQLLRAALRRAAEEQRERRGRDAGRAPDRGGGGSVRRTHRGRTGLDGD